jgi:valyl-tRNA synthetase
VRFSLVMLSVEGQDLKLSPTRFEEGRNFTNKVWNAARFCLLKLSGGGPDEFIPEPGLEPAAGVRTAPAGDESVPSSASPEEATASVPSTDARPRERSFEDRWILARLGHTIVDSTKALEGFRFNEAFRTIRRFVWEDFCDWYVELVKPRLGDNAPAADRAAAQRVLAYVLDHAARLLHPLMPFLTEEIWQYLGQVAPQRSLFDGEAPTTEGSIMQAPWPVLHEDMEDPDAITDMERVQQVIIAVRRIREKRNVPHNERPEVLIATASETEALLYRRHGALIAMMGRTQQPVAGIDVEKPDQAGVEVLPGGTQVFMPVKGNVEAERKRLMKELDNARRQLAKSDTQLNNPAFLERANPAVVERTREQHQKWRELIAKLEQHLADL